MRARPIALTLLGTVASLSAALVPTAPAQAESATVSASCAAPTKPGLMTCFSLRRTGGAATTGTVAGYGPADLRAAYKLPTTGGTGATVAIVDAYDNPRAEADLATYRAQFGLPACTTANGCFKKVNQNGAASPLPAFNAGWAGEISLDLDMVSAVCPSCKILLVEANSAYDNDLFAAEDRAVTLGARYVSNSWGRGEYSGDTSAEVHFNHPGVAITASTGDNGYGASYPATSRYVTAVGGTSLSRATTTSRGWTEKAWSGAGSGCSAFETKPTWQTVTTGCARRAEADVSAVADPNTGVAVYNGGWAVYGGTSASAPIVAAIYALAGTPGATDYPAAYPYAHQTSLFDVTTGTNGTCGPKMCTAGTGWDGPTGLGTPNGVAAFVKGTTTTTPAPAPTPTPTTVAPPKCTAAQVIANGGLESGGTSWTVTAGVVSTTADGERPHAGSRYAWLDGYGVTHTDSLAQTVTIPANCKTATLSYWIKISSADTGTAAHDTLTVKAGTTTLATYTNVNRTAYAQKSLSLAAFIGKSVTITFTGVEDASKPTSFVLDDVALNVA
jgi:subtilase family serine protease